jgi:Flp pilus assembly protein TadB
MDSSEITAVVAILGMVVTFGLPVLIVALALNYKSKRDRMIHDTIAKLAEKGLPVPPELLEHTPRSIGNRDLRSGLVLIAVGIGLMIFFNQIGKSSWAIGLIPGLIGVAFIISWYIDRRLSKQPGPNGR